MVALIGLGVLLDLIPSSGLLSDQLAAIGIGVGLLDFFGLVLIGAAGLPAVAAGGSRAIGLLGELAAEHSYVSDDPLSQ